MFGFLRIARVAERQLIKNPQGYLVAVNFYSDKLSQKEACAVKKSWRNLKDKVENVGKDFFACLFEKNPDYVRLFKRFGDCPEEILANPCFVKDHAAAVVMKAFGDAVLKIDEACELEDVCKDIGKKHIPYCMKPEHFKNAGTPLFKAIEKNSCEMDCDLKVGWKKAIDTITTLLGKGLA